MKRITLGALALLLTLQAATAATFTIATSWTTLRARPSADAPALGLAFGNDALPLVERRGDWVAVQLSKGRLGWLPATAGVVQPAPDAGAAAVPAAPAVQTAATPLARSAPVRPVALELPPPAGGTGPLWVRADLMAPGGT